MFIVSQVLWFMHEHSLKLACLAHCSNFVAHFTVKPDDITITWSNMMVPNPSLKINPTAPDKVSSTNWLVPDTGHFVPDKKYQSNRANIVFCGPWNKKEPMKSLVTTIKPPVNYIIQNRIFINFTKIKKPVVLDNYLFAPDNVRDRPLIFRLGRIMMPFFETMTRMKAFGLQRLPLQESHVIVNSL
jgi:hypothetical protein